jgi:hypothetical protein
MYLDSARSYVDDMYGADADDQTRDVLERWESVLERLRRDPHECRRELDWVAKLALLESYRERDGLAWDDPKLKTFEAGTDLSTRDGNVVVKPRVAGQTSPRPAAAIRKS